MSKPPFFSIITICRNEARDIHLTADSVVNQTYKNYEWLVIDGASTDGTLNILAKYKKNMAYFVSEKDGGIYDAMNKGIKKATGKYLIFMNGGDLLYDKNVLQKVYDYIAHDKESCAIYFGNCMLHVNNIKEARSIFRDMPLANYIKYRNLPHQSSFWQRYLFEKYGRYDSAYKFSGDYEFMMRTRNEPIAYIDYPIAYYNMADFLRRYRDRSNNKYEHLFEPAMGRLKKREDRKIDIHYNGLASYLHHYIVRGLWQLPNNIYYALPFLHKPWRAFKKIIGVRKK